MKKVLFITACIAVLVVSSVTVSSAGEAIRGLNAGISMPSGDGSEYWNTGFAVGANVFFKASSSMLIGGRIAMNRWTPNEDELLSDAGVSGSGVDISGSATIIEFVPAIRFCPSPDADTKFFGHAGLGLFSMSMESTISSMGREITVATSESNLGMSLGGGVVFGSGEGMKFEICPLYHIVFTEVESTKYISLNVGIIL